MDGLNKGNWGFLDELNKGNWGFSDELNNRGNGLFRLSWMAAAFSYRLNRGTAFSYRLNENDFTLNQEKYI